jgi:hypothetical protein
MNLFCSNCALPQGEENGRFTIDGYVCDACGTLSRCPHPDDCRPEQPEQSLKGDRRGKQLSGMEEIQRHLNDVSAATVLSWWRCRSCPIFKEEGIWFADAEALAAWFAAFQAERDLSVRPEPRLMARLW